MAEGGADPVLFLETYRGRDKFIRLLNYGCYILSGFAKRLGKGDLDWKMNELASQLSNLRVMLRLFDDLAMLRFSTGYGLGKTEKDPILRVLKVCKNVVDQCYYPMEHVAWLRDVKVLKGDSSKLWIIGTFVWLFSLTLDILIATRTLLNVHRQSAKKKKTLEHQVSADSWKADYIAVQKENYRTGKITRHLIATIVGSASDAINAINWMPEGILWANKLPSEAVGLFGVMSNSLYVLQDSVSNNMIDMGK